MDEIKLELTVNEANVILETLGQQPYLKVAALIQKIQQQGAAQLQDLQVQQQSNTPVAINETTDKLVEAKKRKEAIKKT